MSRTWFWTTAAALLLTLLLVTPASATELTWIAISGPPDWAPTPGYSLEIGRNHVYTVDQVNGGGVVSLRLTAPAIVRVRRLSDCTPIVRFVAQPGDHFVIRFDRAGRPRVENWNGAGMDSGPALGPAADPNCAPLPDTASGPVGASPAPDPRGTAWSWLSVFAAGLGSICAAGGTWRRASARSQLG